MRAVTAWASTRGVSPRWSDAAAGKSGLTPAHIAAALPAAGRGRVIAAMARPVSAALALWGPRGGTAAWLASHARSTWNGRASTTVLPELPRSLWCGVVLMKCCAGVAKGFAVGHGPTQALLAMILWGLPYAAILVARNVRGSSIARAVSCATEHVDVRVCLHLWRSAVLACCALGVLPIPQVFEVTCVMMVDVPAKVRMRRACGWPHVAGT